MEPSAANLIHFLLLVIVALAAGFDLAQRRIPNSLTLLGLLMALPLQYLIFGSAGIWGALGGMAVGFFGLLPLYAFRAMGAGDVKLMAAVGAFLDPVWAFWVVVIALELAGVWALGVLLARRGLGAYLGRYWQMTRALCATGRVIYIPPAEGEPAGTKLPFGVAIAAATFIWIFWQRGVFAAIAQGL